MHAGPLSDELIPAEPSIHIVHKSARFDAKASSPSLTRGHPGDQSLSHFLAFLRKQGLIEKSEPTTNEVHGASHWGALSTVRLARIGPLHNAGQRFIRVGDQGDRIHPDRCNLTFQFLNIKGGRLTDPSTDTLMILGQRPNGSNQPSPAFLQSYLLQAIHIRCVTVQRPSMGSCRLTSVLGSPRIPSATIHPLVRR